MRVFALMASAVALLVSLVLVAGVSIARADDVTIQVTDQWKPILQNAQTLVDQCVGGGQVHADYSKCRDLWTFLGNLANLPTTPVKAAPAPQPDVNNAPKN